MKTKKQHIKQVVINKEIKRVIIILFLFGVMLGTIFGIILGMVLQQSIFIEGTIKVAEGLEGTSFEINIDLNETELVEGITSYFNETILKKEIEG